MPKTSEFSSLSDLALQKGVTHSQLISEIHERILYEYRKLYPSKPQTVEVIVNEKTGDVKILRDNQDITPHEFSSIAEKIAREVVIEKLEGSPEEKPQIQVKGEPKKESEVGKWLIGILFWGYNLLYVFILSLFIINFLTNKDYRQDIFDFVKSVGAFRSLFITTSSLVPLVSMFTAVKFLRDNNSNKLGTLFFLFEIPLVVIPLTLGNTFTNPTPIMWFFLTILIFSVPVFLIYLLNIKLESKIARLLFTAFTELTLVSLGYVVLLFSFFTPIILGEIARAVLDYFTNDVLRISGSYGPYFNPIEFLFVVFFGGIGIILILSLTSAPYLLLFTVAKTFLKAKDSLTETLGKETVTRLIYTVAAVWFVLFVILSYQPSAEKYIEKLESLSQKQTFEEKESIAKELLPHEAKIKRAFEDLQNVRQRYLMAKSDNFIKVMYTDVLAFNDFSAELIQQTFFLAAYPFVYQGSLDSNYEALRNYQYLFGKNLYTQPTSVPVQAYVDVVKREVKAVTDYDGIIATIVVTEEYKNTLATDQEVIYEFSLPPDSVVTDLKLGPDLEFPGIVAPKGAAGRVYQQELRQRRDPALLEQTGPSQYRLRVFPIPGIRNTIIGGKNQKVQFTYITPISFKGFGLPVYSKEQNVNVNTKSFSVNGEQVAVDATYLKNSSISQTIDTLCTKTTTVVSRSLLASTSAYLVPNIAAASLSGKFDCSKTEVSFIDAATNMKLAVLFDVSYGNKENENIKKAINILNANDSFLSSNTITVYKFNDLLSSPLKITSSNKNELNLTFFGTSDWLKALTGISESGYDAAILITDENLPLQQYVNSLKIKFPVFVVHSEKIPPYTTAVTGRLLQFGGSSFSAIEEAFNAAVLTKFANTILDGNELISVGPTYSYYIGTSLDNLFQTNWPTVSSENDPLVKIVAKRLTDAKTRKQTGDLDSNLSFLDSLNIFAVNNSIVTPYSSLIALVNERQLQNLNQQAQNMDRYKDVTTPQTFTPIQNPAIGISPFGGMQSLELAPGTTMRGGGGPFGALSAPSGISAMDGRGGFGLPGGSLFLVVNLLVLGGGISVFIILKLKKSLKAGKPVTK